MLDHELQAEIDRLMKQFSGAEPAAVEILFALIEQAAQETIYLRRLNGIAGKTGLVKIHPDHLEIQKTLPISNEIARHSAALTNILDKLMKHLGGNEDEEEDGLDDYM